VKLNAFNRVLNVSYAHDFTVVNRNRGDFEALGDGAHLPYQRVVTRGDEGILDTLENAFSVVDYAAGFSMHKTFCGHYFASERADYSLMP
jgi:hypothetical protein